MNKLCLCVMTPSMKRWASRLGELGPLHASIDGTFALTQHPIETYSIMARDPVSGQALLLCVGHRYCADKEKAVDLTDFIQYMYRTFEELGGPPITSLVQDKAAAQWKGLAQHQVDSFVSKYETGHPVHKALSSMATTTTEEGKKLHDAAEFLFDTIMDPYRVRLPSMRDICDTVGLDAVNMAVKDVPVHSSGVVYSDAQKPTDLFTASFVEEYKPLTPYIAKMISLRLLDAWSKLKGMAEPRYSAYEAAVAPMTM